MSLWLQVKAALARLVDFLSTFTHGVDQPPTDEQPPQT